MSDEDNKTNDKKGAGKKQTVAGLEKMVKEQASATDERLGAIEGTVNDLSEAIETQASAQAEQFTQMMESIKAINVPTSITPDGKGTYDAELVEQTRQFERTKNPEDEVNWLEQSRVTDVNSPEFKDKMEQMKFDQELVKVYVQRSQAPFPDNTFTVTVNGRQLVVIRGVNQVMPRNYVEVMARARTSTYGNVETVEAGTGERVVKNPETRAHRYAFHIVEDRNKEHGPHWLERVMNERVA